MANNVLFRDLVTLKRNGTNIWMAVITGLAIVIMAGGVFTGVRIAGSPGVEISLKPEPAITGRIYVSGAVNNPGLYPVYAGDTLDSIIRAAGGLKEGAELTAVRLSIAGEEEGQKPQKIDINRAEEWLLEALPGVGEAKAGAIINYREENGPFRDLREIMNVPGFGETIYEKLLDYITINEPAD